MAVIQYTGIVNQIRGKLNGSQFSKGRTSNTLVKKASQSKGIRGFQSESRSLFTFVQREWKRLPPVNKASWGQVARNNPDRNRFGEQVILSGYNKYMQCQIRSLMVGDFVPRLPLVDSAPAINNFSVVVNSATFSISSAGTTVLNFSFTMKATPHDDEFWYSLFVSLPFSTGVTTYQGRYSWIYGDVVPANRTISATIDLGAYYPSFSQGMSVEFKTEVYWYGNGVRVQEAFQVYGASAVPQIASFTQDSTSPIAPRVMRVSFINKELLDGVVYRFEARVQQNSGSCPLSPFVTAVNALVTQQLFDNGVYISSSSVAVGFCWGCEVRVVDVASGAIMDVKIVYFSNL